MLLSFSRETMLPYIRAGLAQRAGAAIGDARVKRQTIRRRGPRAEKLLAWARDAGDTIPYDLELWWRSRTPEGHLIGVVSYATAPNAPIRVYPIEILHSSIEFPGARAYPCVRIVLPRSWGWRADRGRSPIMFWSPGDAPTSNALAFARADGFDGMEAFRDFFVPNMGDRFEGVLYTW